MAALVQEDFETAGRLAETRLGFAVHRMAMARQQPEDFPLAYHDLAIAHHEAAEALAEATHTRDLMQILPRLDNVLRSCVACHRQFRVIAREPQGGAKSVEPTPRGQETAPEHSHR